MTGIVTPHVGVWIETPLSSPFLCRLHVTPHVGVWIETLTSRLAPAMFQSHLM